MFEIDEILKNPVSLIKVKSTDEMERYFLDERCVVVSVVSSNIEMRSKKIKYETEKNLKIMTPIQCNSLISEKMKNSDAGFSTLIILNNININFEEKIMTVLLWIELFRRTKIRPHLVITTGTYLIPKLPFVLDEKNIFMTPEASEDMELLYHGKNYSPNSGQVIDSCAETIIEKHSSCGVPREGSVWVVFYSGKKKMNSLFSLLKNGLEGDANIQMLNSFKRNREGERTIVLVEKMESCFISENVDGVFDCMISDFYGNDSEIFYRHSSKQLSELRSGVLTKKGFCHRMCEMDFFESLPKMETVELNSDKCVLEALNLGMDPKKFFRKVLTDTNIKNSHEKLMYLGLCDVEKITIPGKLALKIPLRHRNTGLLISWLMKEKHLFPCIVAVSITELENSLVFFPHNTERGSYVTKTYGNKSPFVVYLELMNKVLEETGDLRPKNLLKISKNLGINHKVLDQLLAKIRNLVDKFSKRKNVEIGLFNTANLIEKLTPYFEIFYQDSIYKISDIDKRIYFSERDSEAYGLDGRKHFPVRDLPTRIVVFDKSKINDSVDSVQRSRNSIFYFSGI